MCCMCSCVKAALSWAWDTFIMVEVISDQRRTRLGELQEVARTLQERYGRPATTTEIWNEEMRTDG